MLGLCLNVKLLAEGSTPSSRANQLGHVLEEEIITAFCARNIEIIKAWNWNEASLYRERKLTAAVRGAPYRSIYGHRAKIEFLLFIKG